MNSTSLATYPTEMMLGLSRYALTLFEESENLTNDQISLLMEAHGKAPSCNLSFQVWIPTGRLDDALCPRHD